jgi:hypothetical protein
VSSGSRPRSSVRFSDAVEHDDESTSLLRGGGGGKVVKMRGLSCAEVRTGVWFECTVREVWVGCAARGGRKWMIFGTKIN